MSNGREQLYCHVCPGLVVIRLEESRVTSGIQLIPRQNKAFVQNNRIGPLTTHPQRLSPAQDRIVKLGAHGSRTMEPV